MRAAHADDPFRDVQAEAKAFLDREVPDVVPPTLVEQLLAAIDHQFGPLSPAPPVTGATIRAACRFCRGKGCLHCDTLAERAYRRQFPSGPEVLATFKRDDPEDMALLPLLLQGIRAGCTLEEAARVVETNAATIRDMQERLETADRDDQP